jgi:hypothetical protein
VTTIEIAAAAVVLIIIVLAVVLAVRALASRRRPQALPGPTGPSSPTAITCPFCKREYDPAETGGRCPGCGAAAPRARR